VQLPPERVLAEMRELGLAATEFGPDGFLPADPAERAALLARFGLAPAGGFVPLVLHDPGRDPGPVVGAVLDAYAAAGAAVLVVAADTGTPGYDRRTQLDPAGWACLLDGLERITDLAAGRGVTVALHPHVGTLVETPVQVQRVLDGSTARLCLDTGHLLVGGGDPALLAADAADRIVHVHLKDVDGDLAGRVRSGELGYAAAVAAGLYRPLGTGNARVADTVAALSAAGYDGWYVLEQDTVLDRPPSTGDGPIRDVRASLDFLAAL